MLRGIPAADVPLHPLNTPGIDWCAPVRLPLPADTRTLPRRLLVDCVPDLGLSDAQDGVIDHAQMGHQTVQIVQRRFYFAL